MPELQVDIRRHGPLAQRSGAITHNDKQERAYCYCDASREFRDAVTKVTAPTAPAMPTLAMEWGRWTP